MVSSAMSAQLAARIRHAGLKSKFVANPQELVPLFRDGDSIGWSGFTGVGYPKVMPTLLSEHVEANNLQGKMKFRLFVGASGGNETETRWADNDMIAFRSPHQVGKSISRGINDGHIKFQDKHLSMFPQDLLYGYYNLQQPKNSINTVMVEASSINEDGNIIPTTSVGATAELVQLADKIIIEVNTAMPEFEGLHDIYVPEAPPHRTPIEIMNVRDRIGTTYIPIDPSKVVAVIEATHADRTPHNTPLDDVCRNIGKHLVEFLLHEVKMGRMPRSLHPLQSGIGNIANAIVGALGDAPFDSLEVWTEVLQDTFLPLLEDGRLDFATATSIRLSPEFFDRFYANLDLYKKKILLRPQTISNSPEVIRRLGCIAMNTPVEVDIYAHANSTNVNGSRMLHGLGGSADFLRNAKLSIMHTPAARATKTDPTGISCIVPMVTHVDQTEHDLDVVVTDQGLADLRGLCPRDRARQIIKYCAHPDYRDQLMDYLETAEQICLKRGALHEPHLLNAAFKMHLNLQDKGTMKVDSW